MCCHNEMKYKFCPNCGLDLRMEIEDCVDIDGNKYKTVKIGNQIWMAENLKVTKFNEGSKIKLIDCDGCWENTKKPAYCYYANDSVGNKATYGALYNWHAVNTGKLAPAGWHVPTDGEWTTLISYLGGESVAAGKLKEAGTTHWKSPNTGATNETGFSALPGGYRVYDGTFDSVGSYGYWWSASANAAAGSWYRYMGCNVASVYRVSNGVQFGFSVRCVRD